MVGPGLRTDLFGWLRLATRGAQRQQLGRASAGGAHAGILWTLVEVDVLVIALLLPCGASGALQQAWVAGVAAHTNRVAALTQVLS